MRLLRVGGRALHKAEARLTMAYHPTMPYSYAPASGPSLHRGGK